MALFGGDERDKFHSFGVFSALVLNVSLVALPFAAITTWLALQNASVYSYQSTPAAKMQTRDALQKAAASLIPDSADQRATWSSLVQHEIDEGDFSAARGFLLSAPAMLPPADAARLIAQVPVNADDKTRADTALVFLDDNVRKQYEAGGSALSASKGNFTLLGDRSELVGMAAAWVKGDPVDAFTFTLSCAGVALAAANDQAALNGASVIKAARNAGKLSANFSASLQARLYAALPPARLKAALAKVFDDPKAAGDPNAVARAVQSSIDAASFQALKDEFTDIKAISDSTSPTGAVMLIAHAQDPRDLKRLRLIADAGGDRAVAVAKRADDVKLLGAAKGTLKMSPALWLDFIALGLSAIGIAVAVLSTLGQALLREWRHGHVGEEAEAKT